MLALICCVSSRASGLVSAPVCAPFGHVIVLDIFGLFPSGGRACTWLSEGGSLLQVPRQSPSRVHLPDTPTVPIVPSRSPSGKARAREGLRPITYSAAEYHPSNGTF